MGRALRIAGLVAVVAGAAVGGLYLKWRPDEAALREQGWLASVAQASAAARDAAKPVLLKFGSHG